MKTRFFAIAPAFAFLLYFCAFPSIASADEAKDTYDKGVASFKAGEYKNAADSFRYANELKPSWKLQYNIGQSEAAAKRYGLALEAFETYMAEGGDDVPSARRDEVSTELDRLRKMVGSVEITAPEGAEIYVDGVKRGDAPLLGKLSVSGGVKHVAWAVIDGKKTKEKAYKIRVGDSTSIVFKAETEGPAKDVVAPEEPSNVEDPGNNYDTEPLQDEPTKNSKMKTAGWIVLGVGVAAVVGGGVTGRLTMKKNNDLETECSEGVDSCPQNAQSDIDSMNTLATTTNILIGVGGVATVAGIVMLAVSRKRGKEVQQEAGVSITPTIGVQTAGVSIMGRF